LQELRRGWGQARGERHVPWVVGSAPLLDAFGLFSRSSRAESLRDDGARLIVQGS
jgi:hypothetical protein